MELAGYCRVSRVAGRDHLISPELQERRIRTFADYRGWTVEMFPPELDVSGSRARRPVLESIIEQIERGEFDGVIVSQIDRLSRMEMTTALSVIERIESVGGQVVAVAENVDPTTPEGRMARNVFLSLAAMERERHANHLADAKARAVRLGIWPMSGIPYGYSKGDDRKLHPNEDAVRVRRGFECRASGGSWTDVAKIIPRGYSGVGKIIQNRVYLGEITVGDWHNPSAHEPIVDRALFESAQIHNPAPHRHEDSGALLKGRVRCANCRRTMSPNQHAYRCRGRSKPCDSPARVPIDRLDAIAERLVIDLAGRAGAVAVEQNDSLADLELAEAELIAYQRATSAAGDEAMFADGLRQRVDAVRDARAKIRITRTETPAVNVADEWPNLSIDDRRHVLGGLIGLVWVWNANQFRFIAADSSPDGLSGPGVKGAELDPVENTDLPGEIRIPPP